MIAVQLVTKILGCPLALDSLGVLIGGTSLDHWQTEACDLDSNALQGQCPTLTNPTIFGGQGCK